MCSSALESSMVIVPLHFLQLQLHNNSQVLGSIIRLHLFSTGISIGILKGDTQQTKCITSCFTTMWLKVELLVEEW